MKNYAYQNQELTAAERADDLLAKMSLEEKVRQLRGMAISGDIDGEALADSLGEVVVYAAKQTPKETADYMNKIQREAVSRSRFGIPVIIHAEALSGSLIPGAPVYPAPIGMAATFMPELIEEMSGHIREEMRNVGVRQALSPVLDLARDFRWGRTNETYGSDPTVVSAFGTAYVKGLQGEDLRDGVAATCKHFLGYSQTEGGLNTARTVTDWRDMREHFAKPFEAVIRMANIKSIMNSYSEYDGENICASRRMLTDLLRNDLGFDGPVVSDYGSLVRLKDNSRMAEDYQEAGIMAIKAGMDVELPRADCFGENLVQAVRDGKVEEWYIDQAAKRVLKLKFELGLFDKPYVEYRDIDFQEGYHLSEKITEKLITLTKNEGILPLKDRSLKLAVIGPTGNNLRMMNGSYTLPGSLDMIFAGQSQEGVDNENATRVPDEYSRMEPQVTAQIESILREIYPFAKTIFEAVKERFPNAEYVEGCDIGDGDFYEKDKVVDAAKSADVVILTVGGKNGWGSNCTDGEGLDNTYAGLLGKQEELIRDIYAVNKNIVLVHTDNKPLINSFAYEHLSAIMEGWLPGLFGGEVIARCLSGEVNPGGHLAVDIPRSTGQMPVYYYQNKGCRSDLPLYGLNQHGYLNETCVAMRPFGYGLSYTTFAYHCGEMEVQDQEKLILSFKVEVANTGSVEGDETVQLYGIDEVGSVIRPQKILLGFQRVSLKPGEKKTVNFVLHLDQMAFQDLSGEWILEKGKFTFEIGRNSREAEKTYSYILESTRKIDYRNRHYIAGSKCM